MRALPSMPPMVLHLMYVACMWHLYYRAFATAAGIFMNSNTLPIVLMQSLVNTVPEMKWTMRCVVER